MTPSARPSGVIAAHYQRAGEIKTGMVGGYNVKPDHFDRPRPDGSGTRVYS